jgi:NADH-quinone oxidoreductase subunit N
VLLAAGGFQAPHLDYHALAPEIVLGGALILLLLVDLLFEDRARWATSTIAGMGLLGALIPIATLALDGGDRSMFGGAYVVDNFALVLKALFLIAGYLTVLISTDYIAEGDYYENEYYFLLLSSIFGMTVMASSRDLISIFIALETLSIPAYLLAGWRKRDLKGNEASLKYYLLGVFASAVMLYGMSLVFGASGSTVLTDIREALTTGDASAPLVTIGVLFVVVGFAFKVSAVPFHTWAPDTYEGAPTPITAFLSVASKAAGFVALLSLVFIAFAGRDDVWTPLFWFLSAITMTVGNLIALRQTNMVRLLAYSSVAQAGYMLAPFAVAGELRHPEDAVSAVVTYLIVYAAMNLGAFAVVMAIARKTRSAELHTYGGLFEYAPGLTVLLSVFFFALAGIPPLGGWFAKLAVLSVLVDASTPWSISLAVLVGLNSVVALFVYARPARETWMRPNPDGDRTPIKVPAALSSAIALCAIGTIVLGVLPNLVARFADLADFLG